MESGAARVARLRAEIAAGTYAPEPDAVAESVLAWVAPPGAFDRAARPTRRDQGRLDAPSDADDTAHRSRPRR